MSYVIELEQLKTFLFILVLSVIGNMCNCVTLEIITKNEYLGKLLLLGRDFILVYNMQ